jgi:hypothetical protein
MAKAQGVSKATINRIWQGHHLQPHRTKNFKLSRDPQFLEKLTDVVGLYLNPPEHALVLCVGEKSQIQALDRIQPGLPMKKGRYGTMTHDYKCNGTTTLFAALSMLDGKVIGDCMPRHHPQEFIRYLKQIDAARDAVAKGQALDLVRVLGGMAIATMRADGAHGSSSPRTATWSGSMSPPTAAVSSCPGRAGAD